MYAQGHLDYAADYAHEPEPLRAGLIKAKTYLAYERQLRNLQLQETRLRRHRQNDLDELAGLQAERQAERDRQRKLAVKSLLDAFEAGTQEQWTPQENGFDFSIDEILPLAHSVRAQIYGAAASHQRKKAS